MVVAALKTTTNDPPAAAPGGLTLWIINDTKHLPQALDEGHMRKRESARVLGPYKEGDLWRIVVVDERGQRRSATVACEKEAKRLVAREQEKLAGHTVGWAIGEWTAARERSGVILPQTAGHQAARARAMLASLLDRPIASVTAGQAQAAYDRHATAPALHGRPLAAASNRFDLGLCRTMWKWALKRGHCAANVWADVEPIGRPRKGKAQLTGREASKLIAQAHSEALLWSHPLAVAVLCCLFIGVRSSEALGITAGDLDGQHVRINGTKTPSARRRLRMPDLLRVHLERLAAQVTTEQRLFPYDRKQLYFYEVLLCRRAGVPRVTPHGLRASWASLSVDGGDSVEAVSRALGHSNLAVTLGHYVSRDAANNAKTAGFERAITVPESFREGS